MRTPVALAAASVCLLACNEHVFRYVPDTCATAQVQERSVPQQKAADILLVVDVSGSMCEEQEALARNFFDDRCAITADGVTGSTDLSFGNIKADYRNPTAAQVDELDETCGFIQILAAYDNDFRVGVITTDVSGCDNDQGTADGYEVDGVLTSVCGDRFEADWGRRPQRGCLQAPPGAAKKTFDRGDRDVAERFQATLHEIGVFGSAFERGLDAMQIFLDPASDRAAGCDGDLQAFLRPNAKLVVVFLTDEEDCSHEGADFPDENEGEVCGIDGRAPTSTLTPASCYADAPGSLAHQLAPVAGYADFLLGLKDDGDVAVAVIAGLAPGDDGALVAAGCLVGDDGAPSTACAPSYGNSNFASICGGADPPCCVADPGTRYLQLVDALGPQRAQANSICSASFRATMIDIARFISAVDYVDLVEPPDDPDAVVVLLTRGDAPAPEAVPRLPEGVDCAEGHGWTFARADRIQLCGRYAPKPGDEVAVHARDDRGTGDAGCVLR